MRVVCLIILHVFACLNINAQKQIKCDYAVMHTKVIFTKIRINYSDGHVRNLKARGVIDSSDVKNIYFTRDEVIFKGFKLLNDEGYEFVSALRRKFYFRRKENE